MQKLFNAFSLLRRFRLGLTIFLPAVWIYDEPPLKIVERCRKYPLMFPPLSWVSDLLRRMAFRFFISRCLYNRSRRHVIIILLWISIRNPVGVYYRHDTRGTVIWKLGINLRCYFAKQNWRWHNTKFIIAYTYVL